jgi:uncharacterized protein (TIGR00297 family)
LLSWIFSGLLVVLLLITVVSHPGLHGQLAIGAVLTFAFALAAWRIRGVTLDGAASGFLVTLMFFVAGGAPMFGAVLLVFLLTYTATKMGRARKVGLHIAERPAGRNAAQILANLGCAALAAALAQLTPWRVPFMTASIAALAEAACDTVSSEAGKALAPTARLITSWELVSAGTDGAVSVTGTLLGTVAAILVAVEALATGLLPPSRAIVAAIAGVAGMFTDSALGATMERRGWLTNDGVNFLSTCISAVIAILAQT